MIWVERRQSGTCRRLEFAIAQLERNDENLAPDLAERSHFGHFCAEHNFDCNIGDSLLLRILGIRCA
jgi:hypothetical protein